jgi:hypothetical protein
VFEIDCIQYREPKREVSEGEYIYRNQKQYYHVTGGFCKRKEREREGGREGEKEEREGGRVCVRECENK